MSLRKAPLRFLLYLISTDLISHVNEEQLKLFRSEYPNIDLTISETKPAYQLEAEIESINAFMEKNKIGFYSEGWSAQ